LFSLGSVQIEFEIQFREFDLDKFTLISWDAPGFGKSRPPERDYNNCYERDADLAVKFMKELGYDLFNLMGFSDVGRTALILSGKYPEVVKRLVIWGTSAFNSPKEKKTLSLCRDISGWSDERRNIYEAVYGDDLQAIWSKWVDENNKLGDFASNFLPKIKCPTLILYGENDIIAPKEPHALFLKKNIAGSRLIIFPKAPHNCHQERADFNRIVQEFLLK